MDRTAEMIQMLRDPLGIPTHPFIFQIFMIIFFVFHIIFVNLTIGNIFLSIYFRTKRDEYHQNISYALLRSVTFMISAAILFGIAPLLFVQVIYDPFFYTASTLLATFVILFVLILMAAYSFIYIAIFKGKKNDKLFYIFTIISLFLFTFAGFIMHSVVYLSLLPDKWLSLYAVGNPVNTSGLSLKYFSLPRFFHFIVPSFAMSGLFMMLYSDYFKTREDYDKNYLSFVYFSGAKIFFYILILQFIVGVWFIFSIPSEFQIYFNPIFITGFVFACFLLYHAYKAQKEEGKSLKLGFLSIITVFFMAYAREILRTKYVGRFGYKIWDYNVNLDIGSFLLFLFTFIMGLSVILYLIFIAYKTGKAKKEYSPSEGLIKWGKFNIFLLLLWIIIVVSIGVYFYVKNF